MKGLFGLSFLNLGSLFVCFGLMARENACQRNLEESFFLGGSLCLIVGGIVCATAITHTLGNWIIALRRRR